MFAYSPTFLLKGPKMRFERELLKGLAPTLVMELLTRQSMYGYELSEALAKSSNGIFSLGKGTLYPLLYNLEAKKLITGSWQRGPTGRDRKYYCLTAKGKRQLARSLEELRQLNKGLQLILQPSLARA